MFKRITFLSLLLVLSAYCPSAVDACTKPVFRYALERWPASAYRLVVLHQGPLDDKTKAATGELLPEGAFNLSAHFFDVEKKLPEGVVRDRWTADPDPARLPLALLLPPARVETELPILWEGRFDSTGAKAFGRQLYSPVVRQMLRKLASGDTAVWIVVKGSDEAANQRRCKLLDKSLSKFKQELKLPHEQDPQDSQYDDDLAPGIPMQMSFSVIEADLNEPANRLLKASLMANDSDSLKQPGPKIIPVFARGRALAVLYGEEIDAEVFRDITFFLVGPCSCRVKELNPGFDLPAPFPWDAILYEETELDAAMKQFPDARAKRSEIGGDSK